MAKAARSWSLNTEDAEFDATEALDSRTRGRVKTIEEISEDIAARRQQKAAANVASNSRIGDLGLTLAMAERQAQQTGADPGHFVDKPDGKGGTTREFVASGEIERLRAQIEAEKKKKNESYKFPFDPLPLVKDALATKQVFVRTTLPDVVVPPGENHGQLFARLVAELNQFQKQLESVWTAPRTVDEVVALACAEILRMAKPPSFAGLRRGYSHDPTGNRRVANPHGRILWQVQKHGAFLTPAGGRYLDTRDGIANLTWMDPEGYCKRVEAHIRSIYTDDDGALSEKDKPALLAACDSAIWNQYRLIAEVWLAAWAAGFRDVSLPHDLPVESILGVERFSDAVRMRDDDFTADSPATDAAEDDLGDDGNDQDADDGDDQDAEREFG